MFENSRDWIISSRASILEEGSETMYDASLVDEDIVQTTTSLDGYRNIE